MRTRGGVAVLLLAATLATGCSRAIVSWTRFRSHDAYTDYAYESYRERRASGPMSKQDVLATLGPPIEILAQESGDVFVYRRRARDTRTLNLNPSFISFLAAAPPIPVYYRSATSGFSDTLMVFFDGEGRVVDDGQRFDIEGMGEMLGLEGGSRDR